MPELAEVEYGRRLAERVCRGRKILKVELSPDPIVFAEDTPRTLSLIHISEPTRPY